LKVIIKFKKIIKFRGITNGKVGCHEKKWASHISMVIPLKYPKTRKEVNAVKGISIAVSPLTTMMSLP